MDIYLMAAEFLFLVITFQFVTAPRLSLGEYWDVVNHNEEFLKNNPSFIDVNPPRSNLPGYILGIIFILIIGIGVEQKSTPLLQFVHYASVVVFVGQFFHNYFYLNVESHIL